MNYISATRRAWSRLDDYRGPRPEPSERLISVTSLISPPRIVRLTALHRSEIPPPVPGDDTWSLLGTAVHAALEKASSLTDPPPLLIERREETQVSGWTLSGQIDVLEADGTLIDYKVTSAWSVSDGRQGKGEWASQLNVLKWLLERSGAAPKGVIRSLAVWCICRDWQASQAARDENYPQSQEVAIPIPVWPEDETFRFITERIALHEAARTVLPECTPEERWARDSGWAVLKSAKSARADRIFPTEEEAKRYVKEVLIGRGILEYRPGTSNRCARFCKVNFACSFFKNQLDKR